MRATPAPRRRWRPAGLAATAIAAVAIGAYLIQPGDPAAGAPASSLVPLPYRAESVGPLPEAAGPAVAVPEADAKAARWTAVLPDRRPPRDDALPVEPPRTDATAGKGARRLLASAEPAVPVGESAAEPAPAPVIVAAVTPVVRPRTPEQELDDALARCRDGGALDRFLCDQRARIAWCEGRWGQHPQCASGRTADYGQ